MNIVRFAGTVIKGDQVGRTIAFPTANLDTEKHGLKPAGVYCGYVTVDGKRYSAVFCVNWQNIVEVHILDGFNKDIYGETVEVEAVEFIRTMERIEDTNVSAIVCFR